MAPVVTGWASVPQEFERMVVPALSFGPCLQRATGCEVVALATGRVGSLFSRSTFALWRDVESLRVFDGVEKRDVV